MDETKLINLTDNDSANLVFDFINRGEQYGNQKIDMIICNDKHWFKGKDIATILGYKNTKDALSDNIDNDDKIKLECLFMKGSPQLPLKGNQKNTIYINESGLYSLILNSKLPSAKNFKKWVTGELLPKIRKIGQDKYLKQLQETQLQLQEKDQQIAKLETKQLKLESFVRNIKQLEKDQIFYLATTPNYARQNRFEYGGVKDAKELKTRLAPYNTGRPEGDLYYYTKIFKCNNYKQIEERVGTILQQFKDKPNSRKEMVNLRYNLLVEVVEFICDNYDREIDYINSRCQQFLTETINADTFIPEPVDLNDYLEITVRRGGVTRHNRIDISDWDETQIEQLIETIINKCATNTKKVEYDFSTQKNSIAVELTWSVITPYLDLYNGLSRTDWREKFRRFFSREKPQQLKIKGIKV